MCNEFIVTNYFIVKIRPYDDKMYCFKVKKKLTVFIYVIHRSIEGSCTKNIVDIYIINIVNWHGNLGILSTKKPTLKCIIITR